jgi:hypothetical protein
MQAREAKHKDMDLSLQTPQQREDEEEVLENGCV